MRIFILFAFSLFINLYAHGALGCERGHAKVGQGQNGHALLICHPGILGNDYQSIQGVQLYRFFSAYKENAEFRLKSAEAIGMDFDDIMVYLKDNYAVVEVYSDTPEKLQFVADMYNKYSGASERKPPPNDSTTNLSGRKLQEITEQNKQHIIRVKAGNCDRFPGSAKAVKVKFKDGDQVNLLPVDMVPMPGQPNRFEFSFIYPHLNLSFYHNSQVIKREVYIPVKGDIQWVNDGKSYPIDPEGGFEVFNDFSTSKGRLSDNCELERIVTNVSYDTAVQPVETSPAVDF